MFYVYILDILYVNVYKFFFTITYKYLCSILNILKSSILKHVSQHLKHLDTLGSNLCGIDFFLIISSSLTSQMRFCFVAD